MRDRLQYYLEGVNKIAKARMNTGDFATDQAEAKRRHSTVADEASEGRWRASWSYNF